MQTGTINVSGTVKAKSISFGSYSETIILAGGPINLGATSTITCNSFHTKTISSSLSGAATSLTIAGGTLLLGGNNSYSGQTILNSGTLLITGSHSGSGAITLNSGILNLGNGTSTGSLASTILNINGGEFRHTRNDGTTNQTRTINLRGNNTCANTLAAHIANNGSGAVSVVKQDNGTWVLSGINSYNGPTTVNAGTLLINGSLASGSVVTVNGTATLGGTGSYGGNLDVAAIHQVTCP